MRPAFSTVNAVLWAVIVASLGFAFFAFRPAAKVSAAAMVSPELSGSLAPPSGAETKPYALTYNAAGDLVPPANYREWTYVTSGLDMSYNPKPTSNKSAAPNDMPMTAESQSTFSNIFVNPEAYRSFLITGTWPDKTVMVLESRAASSKGSINKAGHFQSGESQDLELHVKDEKRFPGKWAFFDVASDTKATLIPSAAPCYSCHASHAAVDTTFVQFYPTLLPVAQKRGTLSASYLKENPPEPLK